MEAIVTFFREHGKVMLIGLAGVILGVILNSLLRDKENKKYLKTLVSEFNKLTDISKTRTLNIDEQKRIDKLDSEIYIMKFKCLA